MVRTALVGDTDSALLSALGEELNRAGFKEITICRDGNSAVEWALGSFPDLVILGQDLPGKSGLAAAVEIRSRLKIPVLLLTERYDAETVKRAAGAGIAAFLTKPLRLQDLYPAVSLAIAHTAEVEELRERIEDLKEIIEDQKVIGKAKGVLMEKEHLSEPEAYRLMQKTAMDRRRTLRRIAEEILAGGGVLTG